MSAPEYQLLSYNLILFPAGAAEPGCEGAEEGCEGEGGDQGGGDTAQD